MQKRQFDLSSFAEDTLVESAPKKERGFDLSAFPEAPAQEQAKSPYDDSLLGTGKRMLGNLVTFAGGIPKGLETNIQAGVALAQRLENNPELAAQRAQATQAALKASGYTGGDLADRVSKGAERFTQETLGARPGTPINFKTLGEASPGKKAVMLARGAAETLPVTLANLGLTLANPTMGTAAIYLAETGSTKTALEELGKAGYDQDTQALAAVGAGAFKTALENLGLESLMKAPAGSGIKQKLFKVLTAALSEGSTETLQELTDVVTEAGGKASQAKDALATFGQELSSAVPRLQEAGILGALSGGAIAGGIEASRTPGEKRAAREKQEAQQSQEAEALKSRTEALRVADEKAALIDRLQKERDLAAGGPVIGESTGKIRKTSEVEADIQKRLAEIPEEQIPTDPKLRELLNERTLQRRIAGEDRFDLSEFKEAPKQPVETTASATRNPAEIDNDIMQRTLELESQGAADLASDPVLQKLEAESRAVYAQNAQELQQRKASERETRAQTPGEANSVSFKSALDDFIKAQAETRGKPLSEQLAIAKTRLEEKGYHPAIVDELTSPERLKRPEIDGDVSEATTRPGRLKRAVEPPPELKEQVDLVADKAIKFRDAEASYNKGREEIFREVEKLGGKIIVDSADGTFKIEIKPGKAKLSMQDQLALVKLKQKAAEAGAYSLATVGKGFQVAAAPLRIKEGESLKGSLAEKIAEFISRKNALKAAQSEFRKSEKALVDPYTDFYFKNKLEGKENASLIGRGEVPVEVQLRRKPSDTLPDEPQARKKIIEARREMQKRAQELGPQGEPFVETRKVGTVRAEAEKAAGTSFFDYKRSLSTEELASLDAAQARLDVASREFAGKLYSGPAFSPQIWKEYLEIGHLVAKGLARNLGEKAKITFESFKEAFKNAVGPDLFKRLESHLAHLWEQVKTLPDDWKSGDEVPGVARAEAVENTPELSPSNVAKAERRFDFGLPLLDRLERSNSVGGEIGAKWRKAHGILKTTLGRNAVEIRKIAKEAGVRRNLTTPHLDVVSRQLGWEKRGANLILVDLINHPERMKDYSLTDVEKKIIKLYRETHARNERELARIAGREPRALQFQPTLNNEAREALFVLKGGPLFEALAKVTAERSGLELKKVKQKFASGNLSGLDIPTHVPLKGELIAVGSADAISALQAQNFEFARTLGLLRTFGSKWKNEIKHLREKYDQAGGDLEIFDLIEQGYRGLRPKDWISEKQSSRNLASRLYFRAVDPVFSALALSKSAYMQITQPFIDLQNVGVKNFMKTITEGFGGKLSADDLERMGIISRDILNWKFAEGEKIEDYGRMISALTNRGDLMYAVSLLNDVVSASNWRNFVNSLEGKKLTAKDRQTLRTNLGLTEAEIQKVEQGKFKDPFGENPATPEEEFFVEMVRRGKTQSQHTGKFGGEKSKFQTGSTSPFFLRFQNYTIGEFQRWRRETANLERALKSGDKSERNAAIARVLKLVGTTAVQSELLNIIRHTIKGEWDETEEGSAVGQALKGDYAQATKNFLWNFAEAGFMGAFTRAYLAYQIAQGSATALMDAFFPTNIVHQLWDALGERGRYADKTWDEKIGQFFEDRIPASDLPRAGKRALALLDLAKEDGHKTDAATRAYFKWLEDTGRQKDFPEKEGYVESRRNFLLAYRALNSGDDEEVMPLLIKGFDAKILENERMTPKEALGRLKASLSVRMRVLKKDKGRLVSRFDKKTTEDLKKEIGEEKYDLLVAHDTRLNRLLESLYVTNKHLVRKK